MYDLDLDDDELDFLDDKLKEANEVPLPKASPMMHLGKHNLTEKENQVVNEAIRQMDSQVIKEHKPDTKKYFPKAETGIAKKKVEFM